MCCNGFQVHLDINFRSICPEILVQDYTAEKVLIKWQLKDKGLLVLSLGGLYH